MIHDELEKGKKVQREESLPKIQNFLPNNTQASYQSAQYMRQKQNMSADPTFTNSKGVLPPKKKQQYIQPT